VILRCVHAYINIICVYIYNLEINFLYTYPLTEQINLRTFVSLDSSVFLRDLSSDGDSIYSRENPYEIVGTPVKTCEIVFDMYGDSSENLLENLAVVIILSLISSVYGVCCKECVE